MDKKTTYKLPYIIFCSILVVGCIGRIWLPALFLWLGVIIFAGTGIFYAVSVFMKKSQYFHKYIGWAWIILPVAFAHASIVDRYSRQNEWWIFVLGLYIAVFFMWLWFKDENTEAEEFHWFFDSLICIFLALSVMFCPKALNSSIITDMEFHEATVVKKEIWSNPKSLREELQYELDVKLDGKEYEWVNNTTFDISETYYNSVEIGDNVPICIYTGIFGIEFCYTFEDPWSDFYGFNKRTIIEYEKYIQNQ